MSDGTGEDGGNAASPLSLREAFEKACPLYMSYGMSYYAFWHGDVHAHKMYKEAHRIRMSEQNTMNWLMGQYVYEAIGAWSGIIRAFSKQTKPRKYSDHPYDIFKEDRELREEREARERYRRIREKVAAFADAFNEENAKKKLEGKEVEDNS